MKPTTPPKDTAETIKKVCKDCRLEKSGDDFYKFKKDGRIYLNSYCKRCDIKRSGVWDSNNRERSRAKSTRSYYATKGTDKHKKRTLNDKNKMLARWAVRDAIRAGKLEKGTSCTNMDNNCNGNLQAHHPTGYEGENRLKVLWLCRKHHYDVHNQIREDARKALTQLRKKYL